MAHGCVVVCVSSKHQHRSTHNHRCVEVTEEAAVSQNGPVHKVMVNIQLEDVLLLRRWNKYMSNAPWWLLMVFMVARYGTN